MNPCDAYAGLLDPYVDGELEGAELLRVQEHLDTCQACRQYVDDAFAMRAAFPDEEDVALPEGFHEAVMAKIAESTPVKRRRKSSFGLGTLAAACLAVTVAVGSGAMSSAPEMASPASAPAAEYQQVADVESNGTTLMAKTTGDGAVKEKDALAVQEAPQAAQESLNEMVAPAAPAEATAPAEAAEDQETFFAAVTAQEAEAYLGEERPITLPDGRKAYELTEAAYQALGEALELPPWEDGAELAVVIVEG